MNNKNGSFCRLYRPIGALILLLIILLLLLRGCNTAEPPPLTVAPVAQATAVPPTAVPPTVAPTAAPTATPLAMPALNALVDGDFTADGVKLGGTGQPGATVEVWDGATKVGAAVVGADGKWTLTAKLGEGPHKLAVRTVDAAGKTLNESPAMDVTVPAPLVVPALNLPPPLISRRMASS